MVGEGRGGPPTPDELRTEIVKARLLHDEAIKVAPADIRPSIQTVVEGRSQWFGFQESLEFDVEQIDADDETDALIEENFISGETAAANETWEQWNADNC